jgi:hypothetical protein
VRGNETVPGTGKKEGYTGRAHAAREENALGLRLEAIKYRHKAHGARQINVIGLRRRILKLSILPQTSSEALLKPQPVKASKIRFKRVMVGS